MKMTRGKSIEISDQLNAKSAETIAQWIGCANAIRNQKNNIISTRIHPLACWR
jgi:hypothetical protein